MMEKIHQATAVTAILTKENYIYAGSGGLFQIFDVKKKNKIYEKAIFEHSVIHGIKVLHFDQVQCIVVYGGKQLTVLTDDNGFHTICEHLCKDWILDIASVLYRSESRIVIALAHNNVIVLDWKSNKEVLEVHCVEKCILYSAHFMEENSVSPWENLVLCAGTVFNQVVVWLPGRAPPDERAAVVARIAGHDGVIFDICYDAHNAILLTASDDRSIRMWTCPALEKDALERFSWECGSVLYGHEARIWKTRTFQYGKTTHLISVAEDGFCIIWKMTRVSGSGVLVDVARKLNLRGNLLSLSISETNHFSIGCANGSIHLFDAHTLLSHHQVTTAKPLPLESSGTPKFIKLLTIVSLHVLVHTDAGYLLCYDIKQSSWRIIHSDNDYGSYAVVCVRDNEEMLAMGNTRGSVLILSLNRDCSVECKTEIKDFEGKILSLSWCDSNLFVTGKDGDLRWYALNTNGSQIEVTTVASFILPQAKHRWHTAVLLLEAPKLGFVCGDRRGSLHLFRKGSALPVHTIHGVHGKNGVTSIRSYMSTILTTGRDGYWRRLVAKHDCLLMLSKRRAAQGMDWLERTWVTQCGSDNRLLVWGFHGNRFVIWSAYSGDQLYSLACGGCHRSWDFFANDQQSVFVFLKASQLNIVEVPYDVLKETVILRALHNHQINCARFLTHYSFDGEMASIIVSASEDTKVIISAVVETSPHSQIETLCLIDDHCSSVRSLCLSPLSEDDRSITVEMVTAGSRGSLNAYHVTIQKLSPPTSNCCTLKHLASYHETSKLVPDVRFLSIIACGQGGKGHEVAVACSDGRVRKFSIEDEIIKVEGESADYGHCFLVLTRVGDLIAGGATDGYVYFVTSQMVEVSRLKCHQSGINSIACCEVAVAGQPCFLLATGGDDNSIKLFVLKHGEDEISEMCRHNISDVHSSQVTGLHLRKTNESLELISASIDQRLIRFSILVREASVDCTRLECIVVHVADISGVDISCGRFLVCGRGIVCGKCEKN